MTSKSHSEISNLNQGFSYIDLDPEVRSFVERRTCAIKSLMRRTAQDMIDIGLKLIEIKDILGHGNFKAWLDTEIDCGDWTARKFMEIGRKFKSVKFTDLEIAPSALYLIVSKKTPESAINEILNRARQGGRIAYATAKAIVTCHATSNNAQILNNKNDAQDLQSYSDPISGRLSSGKNIFPSVSDDRVSLNSKVSKVSYKPIIQPQKIAFEKQYSKYSEFISEPSDLISKIDLEKERVPESLFEVGSIICVTTLEHQFPRWAGKVSKVEAQNGKCLKITIEIDKSLG